MSDRVGTPAQVAQSLETCEDKVMELIHAGRIPHVWLGERKVVVPWAALNRWLEDEAHASTLAELRPAPDKGAA